MNTSSKIKLSPTSLKIQKVKNSITEDLKIKTVQSTTENLRFQFQEILPKTNQVNSEAPKKENVYGSGEVKEQDLQASSSLKTETEPSQNSNTSTPHQGVQHPQLPEQMNPSVIPPTPKVLNSAIITNTPKPVQQNILEENGFNFVTSALISRHALAKQESILPKELSKGYDTASSFVLLFVALSLFLSIKKYINQRD